MSFRSFLYENFDQLSHARIEGSLGKAEGAFSDRDPRPRTEMEIVRREGFEVGRTHGFAEGRQAALAEAEVRLARELPDLLVSLGGAAAVMDSVKRACERDALRLTDAALRQVLPIMAGRELGEEAAALVAQVVANVPAPVIEVRAAPRTHAAIERHCGRLPTGVTLVVDAELPEGGVRCVWANGHARFDGAAATDAVLTTLGEYLDRIDPGPSQLEHAQKED
jgi:hypothetical protein